MISLKQEAKSSLDPYSPIYNALSWVYGAVTKNPSVRRAAKMRMFKDSRFDEAELWMPSGCPRNILDAVVDKWNPRTFLDVGCGVGLAMEYLLGKGVECFGIEGSRAAAATSPVKNRITIGNLNRLIELHHKFDLVWSYEVAEHVHPRYTSTFLNTLIEHGDIVVLSAAAPGQGDIGHFNEQPRSYWIRKRMSGLSSTTNSRHICKPCPTIMRGT